MLHDVAGVTARLDDIGRQAEHVDEALVAQHQPRRRVDTAEALRHVVERGVELLLLLPAACCDSRLCREIWRMIRNRVRAIDRSGQRRRATRTWVCSRQSASAARESCWSRRQRRVMPSAGGGAEPFRPSIGLCTRRVCWPPWSRTRCNNGVFCEILSDHRVDFADSAPSACRRHGTSRLRRPSPSATEAKNFS